MTRSLAVLAALVAVLATAPSAFALTFTVNDPSATSNPSACQTASPGCTLPGAIAAANGAADLDTINFSVDAGPFATGDVPAVSQPVLIDGGGTRTVTFAAAATGQLLDLQAANSTLKAITLTGGAPGSTMANLGASGDRLDTVTVHDAGGTGVRIGAGSARVDGSRIQNTGSTGIVVGGASATISSPVISGTNGAGIAIGASSASVSNPNIAGATGNGVTITSDGATISNGAIHGNSGAGVSISGQNDTVTHVVFYGNGGKPILRPGGVAPPQNLRIGPRHADGSLPLTGNGAAGTIELWAGDPAGGGAPAFQTAFDATGDFSYSFPAEPSPGAVFAASQTVPGGGSSEFATVAVPSDVDSPFPTAARALDTANVRIDFSEPLDPATVQSSDFKLAMAGADRGIAAATVSPDGRFVTLTSSGWKAGEAGYVDMTAPGAVADSSGNESTTAPRLRVAAAPGDFLAPLGGQLAVTPKNMCLTRGRNCRKPGMTIKFTASEDGKARLLIKRGDKTLGSRLYSKIVTGLNTIKFNGRLGSRKLRAGRYRLLMYVQDQVGNITDQPPIVLFNVRRVTK